MVISFVKLPYMGENVQQTNLEEGFWFKVLQHRQCVWIAFLRVRLQGFRNPVVPYVG